jgi:hypothetical protein
MDKNGKIRNLSVGAATNFCRYLERMREVMDQ